MEEPRDVPMEYGNNNEPYTLQSLLSKLQSADEGVLIEGLRGLRSCASAHDERVLVAEKYMQSSPKCIEVLNIWDSYRDNRVISRIAVSSVFCLGSLISLSSQAQGAGPWGLALSRSIIKYRLDALQRMLAQDRPRPIIATLLLLTNIAQHSTAAARELQRTFNWQISALAKLGRWRPMKRGDRIGPDLRAYFVGFALAFLRSGDRAVLKTALTTPRFITAMIRGLDKDNMSRIDEVLHVLMERVVQNDAVVRRSLVSFFSANILEHLGKLFAVVSDDVSVTLATLLHVLCCAPNRGLAVPNPQWSADVSLPLTKSGSNMLSLLLSLRPYADAEQKKLVEQVLFVCPDVAIHYINNAAPSLEPQASLGWIAGVSMVSFIIHLPPPPFKHWMRGGSPPVDCMPLLDTIMPRVVQRAALTRAILHTNAHVSFHALSLLLAVFDKLDAVMHDTGSDWTDYWDDLCEELRKRVPDIQAVYSLKQRIGDTSPKQAIDAVSDGLVVGMTVDSVDDDLVEWSGVSVEKLQPMLHARILHVLAGYRKYLGESFVEARFDMAKMVGSLVDEPIVVQSAMLKLLHATPCGPWWLSKPRGITPLSAVLALDGSDARDVALNAISELFMSVDRNDIKRWLDLVTSDSVKHLEAMVAAFIAKPHHYTRTDSIITPIDLVAIDVLRDVSDASWYLSCGLLESIVSSDAEYCTAIAQVYDCAPVRYGAWLHGMAQSKTLKKKDLVNAPEFLAAKCDHVWLHLIDDDALLMTLPFPLLLSGTRQEQLISHQSVLMSALNAIPDTRRQVVAAAHVLRLCDLMDGDALSFCIDMLCKLAPAAGHLIVAHEWTWNTRVIELMDLCRVHIDDRVRQSLLDWTMEDLDQSHLTAPLLHPHQAGMVLNRMLSMDCSDVVLLNKVADVSQGHGVEEETFDKLVSLCLSSTSYDSLLYMLIHSDSGVDHVSRCTKKLVKAYCSAPSPLRVKVLQCLGYSSTAHRHTILKCVGKRVKRGKWSHESVMLPLVIDMLTVAERIPSSLKHFGTDALTSDEWNMGIAEAAFWAVDDDDARGLFVNRAMDGFDACHDDRILVMIKTCLTRGCTIPAPPPKRPAKNVPQYFVRTVMARLSHDPIAVDVAALIASDWGDMSQLLNELVETRNFGNVLCDPKTHAPIAHLVYSLASNTHPSQRSPHVLPILMASYAGGTDEGSMWVSRCLSLWEEAGCGPAEVNYVWGPGAIDQAEAVRLYATPSDKISIALFDGVLDIGRIHATIDMFNLDAACPSTIGPVNVAPVRHLAYVDERDEMVEPYDVAFILSLMRVIVNETDVDAKGLVEIGGIAIAAMALASHQEGTRAVAYSIMAVALDICAASDMLPLSTLLTALRNTVTTENERMSCLIGAFVGRAADVLIHPDHPLFRTLSRVLVKSPSFDTKDIPMIGELFGSGGSNYRRERLWGIETICAGMMDDDAYRICRKKRVLPLLMALYNSHLSDVTSKHAIMGLVRRTCRLRGGAFDLLEHRGLAEWIRVVNDDAGYDCVTDALAAVQASVARKHARGGVGVLISSVSKHTIASARLLRSVLFHAAPRPDEAEQAARIALLRPTSALDLCHNDKLPRAMVLDIVTMAPLRLFDTSDDGLDSITEWCIKTCLTVSPMAVSPISSHEPLVTRALKQLVFKDVAVGADLLKLKRILPERDHVDAEIWAERISAIEAIHI